MAGVSFMWLPPFIVFSTWFVDRICNHPPFGPIIVVYKRNKQ